MLFGSHISLLKADYGIIYLNFISCNMSGWRSFELFECNIFRNSHASNWTYIKKHKEWKVLTTSRIRGSFPFPDGLAPLSSLKHVFLDDAEFQSMHVKKSMVSCRCVSLLCYPQSGLQWEDGLILSMVLTNHHGHGQIYRIGLSHFHGYLLFIQAYSQLDYAYG
jgi:hypothetical protein